MAYLVGRDRDMKAVVGETWGKLISEPLRDHSVLTE